MYKHFRYILIFVLGFLLVCQSVLVQGQRYLGIEGLSEEYFPNIETIDSVRVPSFATDLIQKLYIDGYWLACLEQVDFHSDTIFVAFYQGKKFEKVNYDIEISGSIKDTYYQAIANDLLKSGTAEEQFENLLSQFENAGYPFVSVLVDSSKITGDDLFIKLSIDPGMHIVYDTLSVEPNDIFKKGFLNKYLGVDIGEPYNELEVNKIPLRLENLSFVDLQAVNNTFQLQTSKLSLNLNQRKANHFDGVLGFVPNDEGGGVEFTGEVNLSIKNLFQTAKAIDIHWEKLTKDTQELEVSYLHPIFLGTPLDLIFDFDQLRQDTLFSNRSIQVGFEYYPYPRIKVSASYQNQLGNELNDVSGQSGNFTIDNYIIEGTFWKLDRKIDPKDGVMFTAGMEIGGKDVRDQTETTSSTQYAFFGRFDFYKKIMKKSVVYFGLNGASVNNKTLYLNDLYRIGGLSSIRGFDEGTFYASQYLHTTLEWKLYTDRESNIFLFYDQAFLEYNIVGGEFSDSPSGLGAGMEFMTNSGKFQLIYGLGRRTNQPFSFGTSKVHFGYTALF